MNDKENLRTLFSILNGCLPYEYDVELPTGKGPHASILITKEDSGRIIQITASGPGDDTFTVLAYDDGDDPAKNSETYLWDTDSPDYTLDNILTDIRNGF